MEVTSKKEEKASYKNAVGSPTLDPVEKVIKAGDLSMSHLKVDKKGLRKRAEEET